MWLFKSRNQSTDVQHDDSQQRSWMPVSNETANRKGWKAQQSFSSNPSNADTGLPSTNFFSVETLVQSFVLTGTFVILTGVYSRYLKRYPTAIDIPAAKFGSQCKIRGRVVSVGDGDNFRLYHTPGGIFAGWGWLKKIPFETSKDQTRQITRRILKNGNSTERSLLDSRISRMFRWLQKVTSEISSKSARTPPGQPGERRSKASKISVSRKASFKLSEETIHIRLCGIDAPEASHFGFPAQRYSAEARAWLNNYINGRRVTIQLFSLDQYHRAVGCATIWTITGRKDVSLEMLRAGWAIVYESKMGAAFGSSKSLYTKIEQNTKRAKIGIWQDGENAPESPKLYKQKVKLGKDQAESEKK